MSNQNAQHSKSCPNCGFPATHNYCAQCGQETHLHKDTFFGLIWHFVGHYFHYDSKFWKTLKALWFAPGKLTKEYLEGKRARAIPPISLYIFISAVFFLVSFLMPNPGTQSGAIPQVRISPIDSVGSQQAAPEAHAVPPRQATGAPGNVSIRLKTLSGSFEKLESEQDGALLDNFLHKLPKVFFFMIPFMALLLKILFIRRPGAGFVQHAVFSLHTHSFFFSLYLLDVLMPVPEIDMAWTLLLFAVFSVYFVIALRNVYGIGVFRAILNTLFIGLAYLLTLVCIIVGIVVLVAQSGAHGNAAH